ncbi:hypothetical protein E2C01_027766 [Portunus trituberculatus]|uniref:Gustatory receptor n=1 Tax=Portunus trituberculatus TaxID=210409 RepID=A0A5B7EMI4_PORTR|nr:hypothetical protein [Portunus trituberculatus]
MFPRHLTVGLPYPAAGRTGYSWSPVFFRRLGRSAWGDDRRLQCGTHLLMVVMEWVALLLGLLPLGGLSTLCLREIKTPRLDMILGIVIVEYALAKSVVVLVMLWIKGDVLSSLLLELRKAAQFQTGDPARTLKSFAMFSLPLIDMFPLVMVVTAGHVLHTILADTNVSLKLEIERQDFVNPKESLRLRTLCVRYIHLRGLHQQLSDSLAIPIMSWSLEKLLLLIFTTYSFISYGKYVVGTFTSYFYVMIILMGSVSLFVLCLVADSIADEAAAPLRIISEADLNFAGQVICPEVVIELSRLLKVCERPLVIRPCGMYTISRSNMLAMLSAISTYLVVLLQFQSPRDISFPHPQQGNDSVSL